MQPKPDFRQLYCAHHGISPQNYLRRILRDSLHPHARPFRFFLVLFTPEYFRSDYDFLNDVGQLRRLRDYESAVDDYVTHPWNRRGFRRSFLRLRVSTSRLRRLVKERIKSGDTCAPVTANPNEIQKAAVIAEVSGTK